MMYFRDNGQEKPVNFYPVSVGNRIDKGHDSTLLINSSFHDTVLCFQATEIIINSKNVFIQNIFNDCGHLYNTEGRVDDTKIHKGVGINLKY